MKILLSALANNTRGGLYYSRCDMNAEWETFYLTGTAFLSQRDAWAYILHQSPLCSKVTHTHTNISIECWQPFCNCNHNLNTHTHTHTHTFEAPFGSRRCDSNHHRLGSLGRTPFFCAGSWGGRHSNSTLWSPKLGLARCRDKKETSLTDF